MTLTILNNQKTAASNEINLILAETGKRENTQLQLKVDVHHRPVDTRSGRSKTVRDLMQRVIGAAAPQLTRPFEKAIDAIFICEEEVNDSGFLKLGVQQKLINKVTSTSVC